MPNCLLEINFLIGQVVLKLLVNYNFHHLADNPEQGTGLVLSWINSGIYLVYCDNRLLLVWENTFGEA